MLEDESLEDSTLEDESLKGTVSEEEKALKGELLSEGAGSEEEIAVAERSDPEEETEETTELERLCPEGLPVQEKSSINSGISVCFLIVLFLL